MESLTTDNSVSDVHHTKTEFNGVQSRLNSQFLFFFICDDLMAHMQFVMTIQSHFFPNMTEVMIRTSQPRLMCDLDVKKIIYSLSWLYFCQFYLMVWCLTIYNLALHVLYRSCKALRGYRYVHVRDHDVFECMMMR